MSPKNVIALLVFVVIGFVASRASAAESIVSFQADAAMGLRVISFDRLMLRPATMERDAGPAVEGQRVGNAMAGELIFGGGLRVGPVVGGVDIGLAYGRGAKGPGVQAADVEVRPTGSAFAATIGTYLGVELETRIVTWRLEATLAQEIAAISLERPGFEQTRVSAMNDVRTTAGPRLRVQWPTGWGFGSFHVVVATDARSPENVFAGIGVSM